MFNYSHRISRLKYFTIHNFTLERQLTKETVDNSKEAACGRDNSRDNFILPVDFQQTGIQIFWAFHCPTRGKPGHVGHFHKKGCPKQAEDRLRS